MKTNIGNIDKWLRIIVGLMVLVLGYSYQSWWGLIGAVLTLTALINWCPLYRVFNINTCPRTNK
jgi:hypothetical protein